MNFLNQISRLSSRQEGQGFMEVIVAFGIMIIGIVSILILTSYNLTAADYGEKRLIASNLAREALEVIRNVRDSNWLAENDWDVDLPDDPTDHRQIIRFNESVDGSNYTLQTVGQALETCSDCKLYIENTIFNHDDTKTNSGFRRQVEFRQICAGDLDTPLTIDTACVGNKVGYELKSIVQWTAPNGDFKQVVLIDRIFNWR